MAQKSNTPATLASIQQFSFFNPEQFETMQRVAKMFSSSELVPDMYRADKAGKDKAVSNCIIAIDIANRIEANILMVMQNLIIIYGRPSWSSKFLISTVNTCGRFDSLKFKFKDLGEIKDYKYQEYETTWTGGKKKTNVVNKVLKGPVQNLQCIAWTKQKGSDDILESAPISVEMAINEGWYTKKGSKWTTMTQQMLMYRAASFWTNAYAPELSMGMKTEDELRDIVDIDYVDISDKAEKNVKETIKENANKKNIDFDDGKKPAPEPEQQKEKPEEEQPKSDTPELKKMNFKNMNVAKSFLLDTGIHPAALKSEQDIHDAAATKGIEIVIDEPGF